MASEYETRACPYCKEDIKATALKCKHCGSQVSPSMPSHGGTCPYCKEEIKTEAIKCKHCQSSLIGGARQAGCGCVGPRSGSQHTPYLASTRGLRFGPAGIAPRDCYRLCLDVWRECLRRGGSWELCGRIIDTCNERCDVLFPSPAPEPGDVFVVGR